MTPTQVHGDLAFGNAGFAWLGLDRENQFSVQHLQSTATKHGQSPVRRHTSHRLVVVKVIAELGHVSVVLVLAVGQLAFKKAFVPQPLAQGLHQRRIFSPALTEQVTHAVEYGGCGGEISPFNRACRQHKALRLGVRVKTWIGKQFVGQWLKPSLSGNHALGAALGFVGQVKIFQLLLGGRGVNGRQQLGRHLALFGDAFDHRGAAVFQLTQIAQA